MPVAFVTEFDVEPGDRSTANYDAVNAKLDVAWQSARRACSSTRPASTATSSASSTSGTPRQDAERFYGERLMPTIEAVMAGAGEAEHAAPAPVRLRAPRRHLALEPAAVTGRDHLRHASAARRRRLPDACVERIAAADLVLHAGDLNGIELLRELEAIGPPVAGGLAATRTPRSCSACCRPSGSSRPAARASAWSTTRACARAASTRMRRRFGDRADAVVFGHSHMPVHETDGRLPDLQPRQPDRPPARARAHDGPRAA